MVEARAGGARLATSPDSLGFRLLCFFLDFLAAAFSTIAVVRLALRSFPEHEIVRAINGINNADSFPLLLALLLPGYIFALAWALVQESNPRVFRLPFRGTLRGQHKRCFSFWGASRGGS